MSTAPNPVEKLTPGHPLAQSQDTAAENRKKLAALFPGVLTETAEGIAVNAAALAGYVGAVADDTVRERFGLSWHGKAAARHLALTPSTGTLRPAEGDSVDFEFTQNVLIEGDNLEVLKLLQKAYAGRVKLIYIDPPYNTGNDFVYKDDFRDPIGQYKKTVGDTAEDGAALTSNTDSGGRFHTNWLNMIYPRLLLARELLREDGVICLSLDENEIHHARICLDEIFGAENFLACITAVVNPRGRQSDPHVATAHDYLLCFARNEGAVNSGGAQLTEDQVEDFSETDEIGRYRLLGLRQRGVASRREDRPEMYFPIYVDETTLSVSYEPTPGSQTQIVLPRKSDGSDGRWMWGKKKS